MNRPQQLKWSHRRHKEPFNVLDFEEAAEVVFRFLDRLMMMTRPTRWI